MRPGCYQIQINAKPHCYLSCKEDQELNPPKDKTSESGYGQVKSQVDILTEKILIIEGFDA